MKVYETDKENMPYLLCNVTDRHLKPLAQDAMSHLICKSNEQYCSCSHR